MMPRNRICGVASLCSMIAISVSVAHAQQPSNDDIVVTAQKRSERLKDVPIAISAASNETLARNQISEIVDLPRLTPGLMAKNAAAYQHIYLRGVGSDFNIPGVNPTVSIYVDGIVQQSSQASPPFLDIERVEVLKGPQGTLFGRNTPGGAINIITKSPPKTFEARGEITYGNFDRKEINVAVGAPLGGGFSLSVAGFASDRDSFLTNLNPEGPKVAGIDKYGGRVKLRYEADSGASVELMAKAMKTSNGPAGTPTGLTPFSQIVAQGGQQTSEHNRVYTDQGYTQKFREYGGSLTIRIPTSAFDIVSLTGYSDTHSPGGDDGDGGSRPRAVGPISWFTLVADEDTFSQEFQLVSKNSTKLTWLVGLYYFHDKAAITQLTFPFAAGIPIGPPDILAGRGNITSSLKYNSYAAFAQARYAITDTLGLTLGARYTHDEASLGQIVTNFAPPGPGPASTKHDDFSPKVTVDYKLNDILFYLTWSKGYKSGGYSLSTVTSAALGPETNWALEGGIKADLTRNVYVEASAFRYRFKGLQTTVNPSAQEPTKLINADLAEVIGIEGSATANFGGLRLNGSFSWLIEAKYKKFSEAPGWIDDPVNGGYISIVAPADGNRMQHAPKFSGNIGGTYDILLGDSIVRAGANIAYMGTSEGDPSNRAVAREPAYTLVDANLTYIAPEDRFRVSAWARNLFDKQYFASRIITAATTLAWQGEPRTYGVTVSFKY